MKDDLRIDNALICIRCDQVIVMQKGGFIAHVCKKCQKDLRNQGAHWRKHGMYLTDLKSLRSARAEMLRNKRKQGKVERSPTS